MRSYVVYAGAALLGLGGLTGCSGAIGDPTPGKRSTPGSTSDGTGGWRGDRIDPWPVGPPGIPEVLPRRTASNAQWASAVQIVLNTSSGGLEQNFEGAVTGTTDFSNSEMVLGFDSRNWQDFQSASETLAAQVTATDTALAKVYSGTDPAGFISTVGRRAYRRPLTAAEQATYLTLYNKGSSLIGTRSTFAKGASLVIRAMLQSPYFLYRTELGAKGAPLERYEMAAKLSLWLRRDGPGRQDARSAAGSGKLDTADGAAALATTMLGESAAHDGHAPVPRRMAAFDDFDADLEGRRRDLQKPR